MKQRAATAAATAWPAPRQRYLPGIAADPPTQSPSGALYIKGDDLLAGEPACRQRQEQ